MSVTIRNGIHIESELARFQEKARKYDKIVSLAMEENKLRARIKAIAHERSKLIGVTEKYKGLQ